jgi:hypothetical protein
MIFKTLKPGLTRLRRIKIKPCSKEQGFTYFNDLFSFKFRTPSSQKLHKLRGIKLKIRCELGRPCYFLEGDMWVNATTCAS